jgi:hypothetical protein
VPEDEPGIHVLVPGHRSPSPTPIPGRGCLFSLTVVMEGYPKGSLDHNVPFLLVSGLSSSGTDELLEQHEWNEQGTDVASGMPAISSREAEELHRYFSGLDSRQPPWSGRDKDKLYRFRALTVGRVRMSRISTDP